MARSGLTNPDTVRRARDILNTRFDGRREPQDGDVLRADRFVGIRRLDGAADSEAAKAAQAGTELAAAVTARHIEVEQVPTAKDQITHIPVHTQTLELPIADREA